MAVLPYKVIPEGYIDGKNIPVNVVFVEKRDIQSCGLSFKEAIHKLGGVFEGPVAVNIFDMEAVTTTSDGLMVEGAIVCMGAADKGLVNSEFGILSMAEIEYSDEMIKNEPHLKQWKALFPQRRLFRGPNPADKLIPVHNVVITGRASNNNSATEMMNIVTMEELIFPILGQLTCIKGGEVLVGFTVMPGRPPTAPGSMPRPLKKRFPVSSAPKNIWRKSLFGLWHAAVFPPGN